MSQYAQAGPGPASASEPPAPRSPNARLACVIAAPGTLGADQAEHSERVCHGLDAGRAHPKLPNRPGLRQRLGHQPQVGLGGNSHNHSLARHASPLNHAALGPFIPPPAVLAHVAPRV